jgi:hypothetical protein
MNVRIHRLAVAEIDHEYSSTWRDDEYIARVAKSERRSIGAANGSRFNADPMAAVVRGSLW